MKEKEKKNCGKTFYCYSCLHGFQAKTNEKTRDDCVLLQEHIKYCKQQKPQRVSYPENATTEFKNIHKSLKPPFVGYDNFEYILERMNDVDVTTSIAESSNKEVEYQSHTPASYFTKFVSIDPEFDLQEHDNFEFPEQHSYVGQDAVEHFLDDVQTVADQIFKKNIMKPKEMIYTEEDDKKFKMAKECHFCNEEFIRPQLHCHRENETICFVF